MLKPGGLRSSGLPREFSALCFLRQCPNLSEKQQQEAKATVGKGKTWEQHRRQHFLEALEASAAED